MNQSTVTGLSLEDMRTLEALRSRLMPLVYNIEQLQREAHMTQDAPPEWPSIERHTALLKTHLKTLHDYLNSPIPSEDNHNSQTTPLEILSKLHPYPISPFPAAEKQEMILTLLRKKLEIKEENWVEERIRTASDFCKVPADWGVEPLRAEDDGKHDGDEEGVYGGVKRVRTDMGEDEITEMWEKCGNDIFPMWQNFEKVVKRSEDRNEGTNDDLETIDEYRAQIGMSPASTPSSSRESSPQPEELNVTEQKQPPPLPEQPMLPLDTLLKFMSTGSVDLPAIANT